MSVTIKVRCQYSLHSITLTDGGKLVFHDHPDHRELALAAGALEDIDQLSELRCGAVLLAWRAGKPLQFPFSKELQLKLKAANALRDRRFHRRHCASSQPFGGWASQCATAVQLALQRRATWHRSGRRHPHPGCHS
jgi:hypothetical protein